MERLRQLKEQRLLKDARFLDGAQIEGILLNQGLSKLVQRYFPKSYAKSKPLHALFKEHLPLECHSCGKDLILEPTASSGKAIIVTAHNSTSSPDVMRGIYPVCKGECDQQLRWQLHQQNLIDRWRDVTDLIIPRLYFVWTNRMTNDLRIGAISMDDEVFKKYIHVASAIAQKVFREMDDADWQRYDGIAAIW